MCCLFSWFPFFSVSLGLSERLLSHVQCPFPARPPPSRPGFMKVSSQRKIFLFLLFVFCLVSIQSSLLLCYCLLSCIVTPNSVMMSYQITMRVISVLLSLRSSQTIFLKILSRRRLGMGKDTLLMKKIKLGKEEIGANRGRAEVLWGQHTGRPIPLTSQQQIQDQYHDKFLQQ